MDRAYGKVRENISLPPLKVKSQQSFAERQRRLQAIKRTKNKSTPFLTWTRHVICSVCMCVLYYTNVCDFVKWNNHFIIILHYALQLCYIENWWDYALRGRNDVIHEIFTNMGKGVLDLIGLRLHSIVVCWFVAAPKHFSRSVSSPWLDFARLRSMIGKIVIWRFSVQIWNET